ncbi:MAG: leucine-rich repeat domain-containing protein [Lachnospiraceae bacterium]
MYKASICAEVPAAIEAVRERTFRNCTELKNVSIPEGIRYIGAAAFQNDVSLQTVDFAQSLLTICDNAFEGSGVGEGLVLPPALRTIGSRAFAGCMRLTSLTIPADVRKMGSQAFADGSSPSIVCAFSRTTYMSKLASGWVADWGSGLGSLTFTGGAVNDEQKAAFLQMICKLVPDFNASEANNTLYSGIIGRLGVSAKAGGEAASLLGIVSEQAQEGWIRIPELSTRRAILNLTGIWMQDYCPANTGVEDVYYADGWYYINEVSFAETLTKGYLPKGQNGSGYTFFDSYDAPTGMMDGAVTVLLSESDNDYGIAAQVRSSEKITDGRYINVYESVEERELSESIKDIWMTESASYQFDNYSRILTVQSLVSPDAGIDTHFRYSCKPGEDDGTFTMEWKGMDEANIDQVRTFTVSVDEETQAMKLTDAQTQEEITLNSIAQQANQPTMSGQ